MVTWITLGDMRNDKGDGRLDYVFYTSQHDSL